MKRSLFLISSLASSAALSLRRENLALANPRLRATLRIGRRNLAQFAVPGGCTSHRSGSRWSAYTLRDMLG
ncbi:MAG TPA: hypothetical protein VKG44_05830 [Candidatus Baltobacteraceae bacterium]|nr:hypothetical protein [Candidatus Baltobacteraceae bacterium]